MPEYSKKTRAFVDTFTTDFLVYDSNSKHFHAIFV